MEARGMEHRGMEHGRGGAPALALAPSRRSSRTGRCRTR